MRKIIISAILGFFLVATLVSAQGIYYEIDINYNNGLLSYTNVEVVYSQTPVEDTGDHTARVISSSGETLEEINFFLPIEFIYDTIDSEGNPLGYLEILNETNFTLKIPYHEKAAYISLYNFYDNLKLTIDVGIYSKEKEGFDLSKLFTKDVKREQQEKEIFREKNLLETLQGFWWILLVILVVLALILFYSLKKKK